MSSNQDQARLIAERVARRLAGGAGGSTAPAHTNGSERGAENRRARIVNFVSASPPNHTQSSIGTVRELATPNNQAPLDVFEEGARASHSQVAQSPWLAPFAGSFDVQSANDVTPHSALRTPNSPNHPSQERFGVDEAAVSELVEFFEAEKQCTVDPSGKPCDHCSMCSSRGF